MGGTVLLVDGNPGSLRELALRLQEQGLPIKMVQNSQEALEFLKNNEVSCVVADLENKTLGRLQFLEDIQAQNPWVPVILLSAEPRVEEAVSAIRLGAYDYRLHRTSPEVLCELISAASKEEDFPEVEGGFLTRDPGLKALLERLRVVARSQATILITGESGTGKEVLARWIHSQSDRAKGPFIVVNCAALPEHLLESELFGHEKGAFTGAFTRKLGKFELANGGTILLDEVTEMPLPLQAKFLRVLQEGEVDRLGGAYPVKVDVRVMATTNRNVAKEVEAGRFREDLYFRLNVIPVHLPPLRQRKGDVRLLAEYFQREFATRYRRPVKGFEEGVLEALEEYHWPGNVRELRNVIERAVLLARGPRLTLKDLFPSDLRPQKEGGDLSLRPLKEVEREMILKALRVARGNRTRAAEILGISVRTLRNKLQAYREAGIL